jgi:hypothetical protein
MSKHITEANFRSLAKLTIYLGSILGVYRKGTKFYRRLRNTGVIFLESWLEAAESWSRLSIWMFVCLFCCLFNFLTTFRSGLQCAFGSTDENFYFPACYTLSLLLFVCFLDWVALCYDYSLSSTGLQVPCPHLEPPPKDVFNFLSSWTGLQIRFRGGSIFILGDPDLGVESAL